MLTFFRSARALVSSLAMGVLLLMGGQPAQAQPLTLASHPRLILDAPTLASLREQAAANSPGWQALKAACDSLIGGTVNYPTQTQYPDLPNIGSGYEGESYLPALANESLCYQVLRTSNPTAAATYGAKAVDILMKMSAPYTTGSGNLGENPCIDDGYVIRFFGVSYGLGYDWLYDLLTPAQRTQVYTAGNAHVTAWQAPNGCADFEYDHPQGNYFAGFFHAQEAIALATYDENPSAPAMWTDWLNNQFTARVQPYYAQHLTGGGWPEGFANYAPLAVFNMSMPMREVKTATGLDLIHGAAPYSFPLDMANYAMQFAWPSLNYFDDRDTNHSSSDPTPPGTPQVGIYQSILGTLSYWNDPRVPVFNQYLSAIAANTNGYSPAYPWLAFLSVIPNTPTAPISSLPLSYYASGMGAVAARSDWTAQASWMSFRAAPYTNNPSSGEQYFDEGSLALVKGGTPLLLNATGFAVHNPGGDAGENDVYNDNYGSFNASNETLGNRRPYNIFYVRHATGATGKASEPYGQAAYTLEDNNVRTKVSAYEDGGDYVYTLATHLEDMYRKFSAGTAVAAWSREAVYLRPHRVVVYDRTTDGAAGYDQFMAWHFPAQPVVGTAPAGENRLDVTYNGTYAGAMTTVLPANATLNTLVMYPDDTPIKAYQIQVRPPVATQGTTQQWLSVFDLGATPASVATPTPVVVTSGNAVGVYLAASDGNSVVVSSTGTPGTPISGGLAYTVPTGTAHHVVTDLVPNTGYTVVATANGSSLLNIAVTAGGTTMASAKGVLSFTQTGTGTPPPPPPVGGVPTSAFTYAVNNLTVNFTDHSTDAGGTLSAHTWTFGDTGTSTATSPTHIYAAAGSYTVTETVTDAVSGTQSTSSQVVTVSSPPPPPPAGGTPTANFTSLPQGLSVSFEDASTDAGGTITSYAWTFGDGGSAGVMNPNHVYAANGTYTVTETVTDGVSKKTSTKSVSITVAAVVVPPTQLIINGGFETGQINPWGMSDPSMLCSNGQSGCGGEAANSGHWFTELTSQNVAGNHLALAQMISIPSGNKTIKLSYALHVDNGPLPPAGTAGQHNVIWVQVVDAQGNVLRNLANYNETKATTGYVVYAKSLNAYRGKTVLIRFLGQWNIPTRRTTFTVDDVSVTVQ